VPIYYERKIARLKIEDEVKETIDSEFEEIA
jgi:hypothetical protein